MLPGTESPQTWHPRPSSRISIKGEQKVAATAYPNKGNIKVVPADPEQLTADLADSWWVTDANRYVSYKKKAKGSATFDTVLYPLPEGGDAEVKVTRLDTGVPTTMASALQIDIEDKRGSRTGWYYLSYEEKPPARTVGPLTTDARMVYLESAGNGHPPMLVLEQGGKVRDGIRMLIEADAVLDDLAVEWNAAEKAIRLSTAAGTLPTDLKVYAPFAAKQVTLNGKSVDFFQQGESVAVEKKL